MFVDDLFSAQFDEKKEKKPLFRKATLKRRLRNCLHEIGKAAGGSFNWNEAGNPMGRYLAEADKDENHSRA